MLDESENNDYNGIIVNFFSKMHKYFGLKINFQLNLNKLKEY